MKKPLYLGVFLTPESRTLLLDIIKPLHEERHADHVTIKFKPTDLEIENYSIGRKVKLELGAVVHDEKAQAVLVMGVISANKLPHITISVSREKGGTPNYSNELLENALALRAYVALYPPGLFLEGIIDTFPRTEPIVQGESKDG